MFCATIPTNLAAPKINGDLHTTSVQHQDQNSRRQSDSSNPFKRTAPSAEGQTIWSKNNLSRLCKRIDAVLDGSRCRKSELSVTLSMSVCDYRSVYVAKESRSQPGAIQEALSQSLGNHQKRCVALLPDLENRPKCNIFSVSESLAWSVGELLEAEGLAPKRIDGLPWCLRRAFCQTAESNTSIGIIVDWSYGAPTLAVVVDGELGYVRRLANGGLKQISSQAQADLGLDENEALRWLAHSSKLPQDKEAVRDTLAWMRHCCKEMAAEISAAIDFVRWRFKGRVPECVSLVGGGAAQSGLVKILSSEMAQDVRAWKRPVKDGVLTAEYATAAALAELGVTRAR